jgi:hypothetical protein
MRSNQNNNPNPADNDGEAINADRLIEASIASLKAIVEAAESADGPWAYPADLMGAPNQPRVLCDFTRDEVSEASQFLVRLGIIERPAQGLKPSKNSRQKP